MVSFSFSLSLRFNEVAACLSQCAIVTSCPSLSLQSHGVTTCLSLSLMFAGCLSLSGLSQGVAAYLLLSPMVTCFFSLSLWYHGFAACLPLSPMVASCLSLSFTVPWIYCMSFTISFGCWLSFIVYSSAMELLALSNCLQWFLAVSHFPIRFQRVVT